RRPALRAGARDVPPSASSLNGRRRETAEAAGATRSHPLSVAAAAAAAADEFAGQASMHALALCDCCRCAHDDIPFAKAFAALTTRRRPRRHRRRAPAAAVTSLPRRRGQRLRALRAEPGQSLCLEFGVTELQPGLRVTYGPTKLDLVLDTHTAATGRQLPAQIQCASCDLQGPLCVQLSNQKSALTCECWTAAWPMRWRLTACPKLSGQSDALQTKLTVSRCQLKVTRELVQTLTQLVHAWAASFAQQQSEQQQQQQPIGSPSLLCWHSEGPQYCSMPHYKRASCQP
uniref:Peptidase A1 domain-containing protein n=1 Tax=Macrostomum lignano TaxID=282301 RepID=A0A1I8F8Y0_9PLAT